MPKRNYDLAHFAGKMTGTHQRITDIYDPLSASHGGQKLMMAPFLYPAWPGAPVYLPALTCANEAGWIDELLSALLAGGVMEAFKEPVRFEPQGIAWPELGFQDVGLQTMAGEKAKRRVCMVTANISGGKVNGTGFLVGPQMILTSWHIIEELLVCAMGAEPPCQALPGSHNQLSVQFDYCTGATPLTVGVHEDWLVAWSPSHETERGEIASYADDMDSTGFDCTLDYAVIRLAVAAGRERGYYLLDNVRKLRIPEPVTVYQHPNGYPLQSALGASVALWPAGVETRLRHDANTLGGTSGGLILDQSYEPIALHQGTIKRNDQPVINSAIPITCIARAGIPFNTVQGVDPIWRLQRGGYPVFSRAFFQRCILQALVGKVRVIIVRGEPKSGKSFSIAILRDRLGQTEHCVAEFSAMEAPTSARAMARLLLAKAGVDAADCDTLPDVDNADTASQAWVRDVLVKEFKALLGAYAGNRKVWIVIDDLDVAPLPQTDALFFLERLLEGVADDELLRFVLIGGTRHNSVCPPEFLETEDMEKIGAHDIARTIQLRAVAIMQDTPPDPLMLAKAVVNMARSSEGRYLDELVRAYRALVEAS